MHTNKKQYTIAALTKLRGEINLNPPYQRSGEKVWTNKQKQFLIDTILRKYDIPKIYVQQFPKGEKYRYAVIDGQQRLRAIWDFFDGNLKLAKNARQIGNINIANEEYAVLSPRLQTNFNRYKLDVVIVKNAEEDAVRDLFLRLQGGTTLKAQEKRNAMPGDMQRFVKNIAQHPFFESFGFSDSRYAFDHIAAQMICLELARGPTNIKDNDLNLMYEENHAFNANTREAKKVKQVLRYLHAAFPDERPELKRYNVISLYCLASSLIQDFVVKGTEENFREWFLNFNDKKRREHDELPQNKRKKPYWIDYQNLISHSTDGEDSIGRRLEYFEKDFHSSHRLREKARTRNFSQDQRLSIFRRGREKCQVKQMCDGKQKLRWRGEWDADHIERYENGGQTVVKNGRIACKPCHEELNRQAMTKKNK